MYVDFIKRKKTKTLGPFDDVHIEDVALVADKKEIAYFNRDESYWSEDWEYDTAIDRIVIRN